MITYTFLTGRGNRTENEDVIGIFDIEEFDKLFLLADGDGMPTSVGTAAEIMKEAIKDTYQRQYEQPDCLKRCFEQAKKSLDQAGRQRKRAERKLDPKSTLCLLQVAEHAARWGHIGDSRVYHFKRNKLVNRTLDHSKTQMLCSIGELREEEIRFHPERRQLLQTMSIDENDQSFTLSEWVTIERGDSFLLCSDGFWELVDEYEMMYAASEARDVEEWLKLMEYYLLKNGREYKKDNYSAIAVKIE